MSIKTNLMVNFVLGIGTTAIAAGALTPTVIEKLNENVESRARRITNVVGVYAGCMALGWTVGTLSATNANQIIFTEVSKEILKGCEEAAKAAI